MQVNYFFVVNRDELEEADRLGLKKPGLKFALSQMVFNINDIKYAHINEYGNIDLTLDDGLTYEVEFTPDVWNKIKDTINAREIPK